MGITGVLNEIREALGEEELTPRFLKISIAITVGFLISFGILSYIIVFVILGY